MDPRISQRVHLSQVLAVIFAALFLMLFSPMIASADTLNAYPSSQNGDDTGEAISEITSAGSGINPDTLNAPAASDGAYTVDDGNILYFDAFDFSSIPSGSTISSSTLIYVYGAENSFSATNNIRYNTGGGLTNTGNALTDVTGFVTDHVSLYDLGVDTLAELQSLEIEYTNNDSAGPDAVHFDHLYIYVEYTPPPRVIAGTLYSDEGSTQITSGRTIKLAMGTSSNPAIYSTTTDSGAGTFSFSIFDDGTMATGSPVVVWVDNASEDAVTVTKMPASGNISGLDLYQSTVIVRHEGSTSTALADLDIIDSVTDADISYTASVGSDELTILNGHELHIWSGDTFVNAASSTFSGSFHNDGGVFDDNGGTMKLTGSGETLSGTLTGTSELGAVAVYGSYTSSNNASTSDLTIVSGGSFTAPTLLSVAGDFTQNGSFDSNAGTLYLEKFSTPDTSNATSTGFSFDTAASGNDDPRGVTTDGTYFYVTDYADQEVYRYTLAGSYVGSFDTSASGIVFTESITTDGAYIYVGEGVSASSPLELFRFTLAGTYVDTIFLSSGSGDQLLGIATDGTYFYTLEMFEGSDTYICRYTYAGSVSGCTLIPYSVGGITTDGQYLYASDNTSVRRYTLGRTYIDTFDLSVDNANAEDLTIDGGYLYVVDRTDDEVYEYEFDEFLLPQTHAGTFIGSSALSNVHVIGSSTFATNASTTDLTIGSGAMVTAPTLLSVAGDYLNSGTLTAGTGEVIFSGTSAQTVAGTLTGTSAFYDLTIANTSANGTTSRSVTFSSAASSTGTFTMVASSSVAFLANATTSLNNVSLVGTGVSPVWIYSSSAGTQHYLVVSGSGSIANVNVRDSNVCGSTGGGLTSNGGTDVSNNTCWTFNYEALISIIGTLFSDEGISPITSGKTIKVVIGTSTPGVYFDTTDGSGVYTISATSTGMALDTPVIVFVDADGTTRAAAVTKATSSLSSITGLDLYQDTVIVKQEAGAGNTTLADLATYDSTDDADLQYTASSTLDELAILAGQEFHIWSGDTFVNAASSTFSGSFHNDGGVFTNNSGTMKLTGSGETLSGTLTDTSALGAVAVYGSYTANNNASTSDLTIASGGSFTAPTLFTIAGNYQNSGTYTNGTTLYLTGTSKTLSGTLTNTSDLGSVVVTGSSTFAANASTTDLTIASGAVVAAPTLLSVGGDYQNSGTFNAYSGTLYLTGTSKTLSGTLTGASALNDVAVTGSYAASNNASTSDLTIASGGSFTAPSVLTITGNYTNNGSFDDNSGTLYISGTSPQTFAGAMTNTNGFNDIEVTNTAGNGVSGRAVTFASAASSTGTFTVAASSSVEFAAGTFTTFNNVVWDGGSTSTDPVWIYSSATGSQAYLIVSGTATIYDAMIRDTNVCNSPGGGLTATNTDSVSNNSCWTFAYEEPAAVLLVFSGTLYSDEGTTPITSGKTIKFVVGTSTPGVYFDTTDGSGVYSISATSTDMAAGTPLFAFVDAESSTRAALVTTATSALSSLTDLDLYQNTVIVRAEGTGTTTLSALATYDSSDDSDLMYTTGAGELTIAADQELHIWNNDIFETAASTTILGALHNEGTYYVGNGTTTLAGVAAFDVSGVAHSGEQLPYTVDAAIDMAFNGDGSKFYLFGRTDETIYAYDLSTNYDLSTATYNDEFFDVDAAGHETTAYAFAFNDTGSKLYVMGSASDSVHTYNLSPSYDVSSASYNASEVFVFGGTIESAPKAIEFSANGDRLYLLGTTADTVWTWTLGTNFNVSTAASSTQTFKVSSQDGLPYDLVFSDDGYKMFVIGAFYDNVYAYDLGTAFDPSSAVYGGESYNVTAVESTPYALAFNASGTKLFVGGYAYDTAFGFDIAMRHEGTMVGNSALGDVTVYEKQQLYSAASTTALTVTADALLAAPTTSLTVSGDYTNNGTYVASGGTVYFDGTSQTLTAHATGTSALGNVILGGSGTKSFDGNASTTGLTINSGVTFSAPSQLTIAGSYTNSGTFTDNGGTVYFTTGGATLAGTMTGSSDFGDVVVNGIGTTELQADASVADLTIDPAASFTELSLAHNWAPGDSAVLSEARDVEVVGNMAYVVGFASNNLVILDISSTTNPVVRGNYKPGTGTLEGPNEVEVVGDYAYVTGYTSDNLVVVDISSSTNPTTADTWTPGDVDLLDGAFSVVVDGGYAYITGYLSDNLVIIDVSDPTNISYSGDWDPNNTATMDFPAGLDVVGNYAYVAGYYTGTNVGNLAILNVTNKNSPSLTGNFSPLSTAYDVVVSGDYAYVLSRGGQLRTLDVSTPASPITVGYLSSVFSTPEHLTLSGNYLYATNWGGDSVTVLDLSASTTAPTVMTTWTPGTSVLEEPWDIAVADQGVFVAGGATNNVVSVFSTQSILGLNDNTLSITGDYTNNSVLTADAGTVNFSGTSAQTATGTLSGASAFYNLGVTNTSGTGAGTQSVTFGAPVEVTGTSTLVASTSVAFLAGATSTFENIDWDGGATTTNPAWVYSTNSGTQTYLVVEGNSTVYDVMLKDTNVCGSTGGGLTATNSISVSNNTCWTFTYEVVEEEGGSTVLITGTLYSNEGSNPITSGKTIKLVIGTTTPVIDTTTSNGSGVYSFSTSTANVATDTPIIVFVDADGTTRAAVVTKAASSASNITGLDLYQNAVIVRQEGSTSTTLTDLATYDSTDDTDLQYTASSTLDELTILSGHELHIWSGDTFVNAASSTFSGSFHNDGGVFDDNGGTMKLTGSGETLSGMLTGTSELGAIVVYGSYTSSNNASTSDLTIASGGSLTAPSVLTVTGDLTQNGTYTKGATLYVSDDGFAGRETGFSFDTNIAGNLNPQGITTDGTYFYVVDWNNVRVYRYTLAGIPVDYFSISGSGNGQPIGITTDGTYLYVVDWGDDEVYRYTLTGTHLDNFDTNASGNTDPYGITTDGTYLYTTDYATDDVYRYTMDGVYLDKFDIAVTGNTNPYGITTDGTYLYVVDSGDDEIYQYDAWQRLSGSLTDASDLGDVVFVGSSTKTIIDRASTTDFTITSDSGSVFAPTTTLSVSGDYTNGAILNTGFGGEVIFNGTTAQTATGTMTGSSQFNDLTITNTSGTGATTQSVTFGAPVTTTGTFTMSASTSAAFLAGATSTFQNVAWQGGATTTDPVWLRSTTDSSVWYLDIPGTQLIEYVNVQDSSASSTVTAATSTNAGNNFNWTFVYNGGDTESITGSSTISDHDDGRVSNAFNFQNKTNEPLFSFKLTPESGTATVTELVIALSGAKKIDTADFSNLRLYRDHDNDAAYDAADTQVGGAGVMSLSGKVGTITFSTDFLATTSENYVLIADWNAPENGSVLNFDLYPSGVAAIDSNGAQDIYGSVRSVQHSRNNAGGGGGSSAAVGGDAPVGQGVKTGGTNDGGELIGDDPNYKWPTAHTGAWNNGQYAYDKQDGTYATTATNLATSTFADYGYSVPGTNQITGIEVKLEVSGTTAAGSIDVDLSYDGGSNWTTTKSTGTLTTTDAIVTLGGASDTWGRSWSAANFSNANFRVRVTGNTSSNTLQIDALQVRVYHQATGGSQGGGGAI